MLTCSAIPETRRSSRPWSKASRPAACFPCRAITPSAHPPMLRRRMLWLPAATNSFILVFWTGSPKNTRSGVRRRRMRYSWQSVAEGSGDARGGTKDAPDGAGPYHRDANRSTAGPACTTDFSEHPADHMEELSDLDGLTWHLYSQCARRASGFLRRSSRALTKVAHRLSRLGGGLLFVPRPNDIYIVSYPRSGTTWLQMILYQLTTDGNMDFDHITEFVPFFER